MSNAITNNATAMTRTNGIGSALRCVAVVGREAHDRPARLREDLRQCQPALHDSAKRLDAAHAAAGFQAAHAAAGFQAAHAAAGFQAAPVAAAFAGSEPASAARMAWPRPMSADQYLPPAVWASLVVVRAVSA